MVKLFKRLFSLLTVLVICLSIVPMKVVAELDPIFRPDYKFTNQPEDCIFDSRTSEYTVTWLTDFLVDWFVVYKVISGPAGRYEEIAREPLSSSLGVYTFEDLTPDDAGTYLIKVFPKETDTGVPLSVDSEPFELKYADNYFTVQPQSGDITTDRDYTVTWETNFVPTKVELLEYGNVKETLYDVGKSESYTFTPITKDTSDIYVDTYRLKAYWNDTDYKLSDSFNVSSSSLNVEIPAASVDADMDVRKYHINWRSNFTPVKTELRKFTYGDNSEFVKELTLVSKNEWGSGDIEIDGQIEKDCYYKICSYYNDTQYVSSESLCTKKAEFKFITAPAIVKNSDSELNISAEFNFTPSKVEIVALEPGGEHVIASDNGGYEGLSKKYSYDFNYSLDLSYSLRAYYGDGEDECIKKECSFEYGFTAQPKNSTFSYSENAYIISFRTNFTPLQLQVWKRGASEPSTILQLDPDSANQKEHIYLYGLEDWAFVPGEYYIKAWYSSAEYVNSNNFVLHKTELKFTEQPEDADFVSGQAQAPTITWDINFEPVEFGIVKVNEDGTEESPAWYVDPLPIIRSKQLRSLGVGQYRLAAKYREDAEPVLSRIFTIREFKFNHDPSENDYDLEANYNETCYFTWDLSSKALRQQVFYKPVNSSGPAASIDIKNTAYIYGDIYGYGCEIDSSNKWEDYECFIRAWAKGYEDKYIDSDKFIIHMKGRGVSIEPNGGTYSLAMNDGVPSKEFVDHIEVDENGKAVMPECIMTPPAGTMFDCWVVTDEKAYFYTLEKARENGFSIIYDSNLHDSEYGFNFIKLYPGEEVDEELLQWNVVFPLWKVKSYSYSDCNFDKQYDGEPARICINELITPYIPAEYFTFYYDENGELQNKLKPDMEVKLYERNGAGMTLLSENLTMEYDASVPGGVRFIYETSADVGTYSVEFIYKGNRVLLYDVSITEDTTVTYTKVEAKEPTYTEEGNTEYYIGSDGLYYVLEDDEYIVIGEGSWIIPMLVDEHAGMLPVDEYKANGTYPTQEGKVFAGWFADSEYTTPYMQTTGYAYAKFINEKCITVKWQKRLDNPDPNKTDIRLVSTLDCGDYDSLHFVLTFTDNGFVIKDGQITRLYDSLDGFVNGENVSYTPDIFCEDSKYFAAYTITGMPNSLYDTSLTAQVYIITLDGTRVEGTPLTFKVADDQSNN